MEIGEWGQNVQQGRRPRFSPAGQNKHHNSISIRRRPVYNPVAFYATYPREGKNKTMRVMFRLFIHKWPDIFAGGLRSSRIARWRWDRKKIRVKFHTTRALPIRSWGCQKSKSATRPAAYCHSGRDKRIQQGAVRKCQASDKNQHAGDKK